MQIFRELRRTIEDAHRLTDIYSCSAQLKCVFDYLKHAHAVKRFIGHYTYKVKFITLYSLADMCNSSKFPF